MSVMSMGKKPKALVRPLGAGNSRAGGRPGEVQAGGARLGGIPARKAKRSRRVDGGAAGNCGPPRPRATRRNPPARPRLWVVPDAAVVGRRRAGCCQAGRCQAGRCRAGPRPGRVPGRRRAGPARAAGAQAAGGSRRADPGPAAQHRAAGRPPAADRRARRASPSRTRWSGPHRCPPGPPGGCAGPGSPGAGAGWSGLSRSSSSSRSSPRSCSLWLPGRRRPVRACRRLRCGPACGRSWSSQASRCGRSR